MDASQVTDAQLAATRHVTSVTQVAGPYPQLTITLQPSVPRGARAGRAAAAGTQITVVGRASPGGPLDDLT